MWTPGRTAAVPVLVVGLALMGAPADARADGAHAATERVAAAVAVAADDERQGVAGQAALADAATHTAEQHRAEAAARAEAARVAAEQTAREAAAAQAAAEAAAAQAAADRAAAATAAAAKATTKPVTKPAPAAVARPPAAAGIAWRTTVVNSGGQDAVDRCLGGLTHWYENVDGKPYYTVHRSCGGTPILGLGLGSRIRIDAATWVVTDVRDVPVGSRYHTVAGMNGQILLQTCHLDGVTLRVVALTAA